MITGYCFKSKIVFVKNAKKSIGMATIKEEKSTIVIMASEGKRYRLIRPL